MVEGGVDPHPQATDAVNGSDIAIRVLGDALLINAGLDPVLLDAGLELLDDGAAQFAGHIVESAGDDGGCGIVGHEKRKEGEARDGPPPLKLRLARAVEHTKAARVLHHETGNGLDEAGRAAAGVRQILDLRQLGVANLDHVHGDDVALEGLG